MGPATTEKKKWWVLAKEEGRVCRLCGEPVSKADWKDRILDRLCFMCFQSEVQLPHNPAWRLGRR